MAETLEDFSCDTDRVLDSNGFLNSQFEIFTHDYRELTEVPKCSEHEGGTGCCQPAEEDYGLKKKDLVNVTRRMQRTLLLLRNMKGSEPISDFKQQLESLNQELQTLIKQETLEFSTTTVKLPDFDPVDMDLFIGNDEVPPTQSMLESVTADRQASKKRLAQIVVEADILLQEFDHIKHGI